MQYVREIIIVRGGRILALNVEGVQGLVNDTGVAKGRSTGSWSPPGE